MEKENADRARAADPRAIHPVDSRVAQRLRARRRLLGMTQKQLAGAIGLAFQQVQKYERGANRVSAGRLHDLARVLEVPVSYFFDEPGDGSEVDAAGGNTAETSRLGLKTMMVVQRETFELVQAFSGIADPDLKRRVLELVKMLPEKLAAKPR